MKMQKFLSALCATAMLVTMIPAAFAAETDAEPARFAGMTVPCQVVNVDEDGNVTSDMVYVPIPADATQEEEDSLILAATSPVVYSMNEVVYPIATIKNLTVTGRYGSAFVSCDAEAAYTRITTMFTIDSLGALVNEISVKCEDKTNGAKWEGSFNVNRVPWKVVLNTATNGRISTNDELEFYAKTDSNSSGRETFPECVVTAYTNS